MGDKELEKEVTALVKRVTELEWELLERANMTPEQVVALCLKERAEERERYVPALKEIVGYGLTTPLGVEPTADYYKRCCHDLIGIAARALEGE